MRTKDAKLDGKTFHSIDLQQFKIKYKSILRRGWTKISETSTYIIQEIILNYQFNRRHNPVALGTIPSGRIKIRRLIGANSGSRDIGISQTALNQGDSAHLPQIYVMPSGHAALDTWTAERPDFLNRKT